MNLVGPRCARPRPSIERDEALHSKALPGSGCHCAAFEPWKLPMNLRRVAATFRLRRRFRGISLHGGNASLPSRRIAMSARRHVMSAGQHLTPSRRHVMSPGRHVMSARRQGDPSRRNVTPTRRQTPPSRRHARKPRMGTRDPVGPAARGLVRPPVGRLWKELILRSHRDGELVEAQFKWGKTTEHRGKNSASRVLTAA